MLCIGWSSLLRPALRWYRLVGMRAAGSLILPEEAISPGATILTSKWTVYIWVMSVVVEEQDTLQDH